MGLGSTIGQFTDGDDIQIKGTSGNLADVSAANALKTDGSGVTQPISVTSLPLPTGAATETTLSAQNVLIGAVTETAPASDTASSGLNGRLQRIAQRLTSLIALIPSVIGTAFFTRISDGTNTVAVKAASTAPNASDPAAVVTLSPNGNAVTVASLPLPTGAATEVTLAKLPVAQASTTSGQSGPLAQGAVTTAAPTYSTGQTDPLSLTTAGALRTDSSATTQPISATSLPLPTGAATSALQTTGNASLVSIDAGIPAGLGSATSANSMPVVIASDQVLPVTTADVAPASGSVTTLDTSTSSLIGSNGQVFYVGTPTAGSASVFALSSQENVSVQVSVLGGGGTLVVEISSDGGVGYIRPNVFQPSTTSYSNAFTSSFLVTVPVAGMTNIRVRSTTSWTGTATVLVRETVNTRNITVTDPLPGIVGTIVLPTGAATSALQSTGNSSLSSIDTKLTSQATAANQSTEITSLQLIDNAIGSVAAGTAGTNSFLTGGVFNTALPTVTNGQQVASQFDSSGRQIIAPLTNTSIVKAQLEDNSGNAINSFNSQLLDADLLNTSGQYRAQSVTTSAAEALGAGTILANRKCLFVTPTTGTVYWGFSNAVTTTTGTPIFKNQTFTIAAGPSQHVYLIAAGTIDCRVAEAS